MFFVENINKKQLFPSRKMKVNTILNREREREISKGKAFFKRLEDKEIDFLYMPSFVVEACLVAKYELVQLGR